MLIHDTLGTLHHCYRTTSYASTEIQDICIRPIREFLEYARCRKVDCTLWLRDMWHTHDRFVSLKYMGENTFTGKLLHHKSQVRCRRNNKNHWDINVRHTQGAKVTEKTKKWLWLHGTDKICNDWLNLAKIYMYALTFAESERPKCRQKQHQCKNRKSWQHNKGLRRTSGSSWHVLGHDNLTRLGSSKRDTWSQFMYTCVKAIKLTNCAVFSVSIRLSTYLFMLRLVWTMWSCCVKNIIHCHALCKRHFSRTSSMLFNYLIYEAVV